MEFNLQKVYSAANADTLPIGSYCFFADSIDVLRTWVEHECMECATRLMLVQSDHCQKRFVNDRSEDTSLAYLLTEEFMQEKHYLTREQINKMKDILPFFNNGGYVDTYEAGDYRMSVNFDERNHTYYSLDMTPEITVENDKWKSSLSGKFEQKFMHPEDCYYLTSLSAGVDYPDVVVSDKIVDEVNEAFFSVFNDEYIKNLYAKKENAEELKRMEATHDFFNANEEKKDECQMIKIPRDASLSAFDKIKKWLHNLFIEE